MEIEPEGNREREKEEEEEEEVEWAGVRGTDARKEGEDDQTMELHSRNALFPNSDSSGTSKCRTTTGQYR